MKIIVFVKQVPDTTEVKLDPETGNLDRTGVVSILNPIDANAVEAAVRIKEQFEGTTVCAVTMGPPQADDVLKKAMAMGCDEGYLLSDRCFGRADTLATGYVLAKAVEKIGGADLLIAGRHASDGETAQTGPIIATFLGLPQITLAESVEVDGDRIICSRTTETAREKAAVKMPALITVCAGINEPRYPTPINIMKAVKKPRITWGCDELGADSCQCGVPGSPSVVTKLFEPVHEKVETEYFTGEIPEMAKKFVDMLESEHLI